MLSSLDRDAKLLLILKEQLTSGLMLRSHNSDSIIILNNFISETVLFTVGKTMNLSNIAFS